jgi:hypothetical protein
MLQAANCFVITGLKIVAVDYYFSSDSTRQNLESLDYMLEVWHSLLNWNAHLGKI